MNSFLERMNYKAEFERAYEKAYKFFGIELKGIKLEIIKSPEKVFKNKKIPWYAVGFYTKNKIILVDKQLFPSRGHEKNEFSKVMLHEICHLFIKKIVKKRIPVWIEEGLCQFISFGGKLKPKKAVSLRKLKTYKDWYNYDDPYVYCGSFYSWLFKKYGKEKILEFLKMLNEFSTEKAFEKVFKNKLEKEEKIFRKELKKC